MQRLPGKGSAVARLPICVVPDLIACHSLQFVSEFTGNKMEGEKLERVYHKIKSGKATAAAVHSIGAGTSGMTFTTS